MKMEDLKNITDVDVIKWETIDFYGITVYDDFCQIIKTKVQDPELRKALCTTAKCDRSNRLFFTFTVMNEPVCLVASQAAGVNITGYQMSFKWLL